ncbi:hypothetical protein EST38_g2109 [Candolleomyces aberdarensis]|uniref:Uncharacterized protein n=1 Tax=Candolleomyces aberdarensis TaxID=2316362 RepID=A0A4Q2DWC3_9AGAR|nr:hypothetical protein EST38_g2109 [Candolleomyces aberdarensis]
MQSSTTVADILVLLWTWIDKRTQRPLFMIEPDPKDAECHGCIINCMLYYYTLDSEDAKRLLLDRFSDEGFGYAAAERFVLAGMAHADRMREASERSEWDHRIIGRNYRQIVEMFDGFTKLGDPTLIAALRKSPFIQVFVSGISAFTKRLWVEEHPSTYLYPLMLISCEIQEWIDTPGIPTIDGISQLVRGGFFSIFLEATLYGPKSIAKSNKMSENWDTICKELVALVMAYASYRSALFAIREAIANIDPAQHEKLSEMVESTPTSALWKMLAVCTRMRLFGLRNVIAGGFSSCDNLWVRLFSAFWLSLKATANLGDFTSTIKPQELGKLAPAISRHAPAVILPYIAPKPVRRSIGISAIATTVQRLSFDTDGLERTLNHTWLHASSRLFHLSALLDTYRNSMAQMEADRRERYPHIPSSELIVSFDLAHGPWSFLPADTPVLYKISEYLDPQGPRAKALRDIGQAKFRAMINDFVRNTDVRLVEGIFKFEDKFVWVLMRVRVTTTEDGVGKQESAIALNGISYLGLEYTCTERIVRGTE